MSGDDSTVPELDLRVAFLLRFQRVAGNHLRLHRKNPRRPVGALDRKGSRKLDDRAIGQGTTRNQTSQQGKNGATVFHDDLLSCIVPRSCA